MHVDVRLVQDDNGVVARPHQEPQHLQPHLQAVAHHGQLANERPISDLKREVAIYLMQRWDFEALYLQARPGFACRDTEVVEVGAEQTKLIAKMRRRGATRNPSITVRSERSSSFR